MTGRSIDEVRREEGDLRRALGALSPADPESRERRDEINTRLDELRAERVALANQAMTATIVRLAKKKGGRHARRA